MRGGRYGVRPRGGRHWLPLLSLLVCLLAGHVATSPTSGPVSRGEVVPAAVATVPTAFRAAPAVATFARGTDASSTGDVGCLCCPSPSAEACFVAQRVSETSPLTPAPRPARRFPAAVTARSSRSGTEPGLVTAPSLSELALLRV